jgi:hypothetical protein
MTKPAGPGVSSLPVEASCEEASCEEVSCATAPLDDVSWDGASPAGGAAAAFPSFPEIPEALAPACETGPSSSILGVQAAAGSARHAASKIAIIRFMG